MIKKIFWQLFAIVSVLLGLYSCSGNDENSSSVEKAKVIILSLNKESIDLDEKEVFSFKVMTDLDEDVTLKSSLYVNDEMISSKEDFSPKKTGFYEIKATYGNLVSNVINAEVRGTVLEEIFITPNVMVMDLASEEVFTFSVKTDLAIETTSLSIFYVDGEKIEGNTFKPQKEGEYKVYAMYKNRRSETITLLVKEKIIDHSIIISSDLETISTNSEEGFTFNVKTDLGFDVTSSSAFYVNGEKIEGNVYKPTEEGKYSVYAIYGGYTSETIEVTAEKKIIENTIVTSAENYAVDLNSEERFVFEVKTDLGVNVTSESILYVNGEKIEGNTYKPTVEGDYEVYAVYENYTSEAITVQAKKEIIDNKIIVSASPIKVDINSEEEFTFSVKTDLGVTITSVSTLYVNGEEIEGNTYKPTVEGDYEVYAVYENYTSETITVQAKKEIIDSKIIVSASPTKVDINSEEEFTFSVKTDLGVTITSVSTLYVNGEEIEGNTYKPTVEGDYEVYAVYENYTSDVVTVTAQDSSVNSIILSVGNASIKIGADQEFVFAVQTDKNEDVTSSVALYVNGSEITGNTYKPTVEGTYEIYGMYENIKSNTITVSAQLATFVKNALIEDFTGTWCGWCPRVSYAIEQVKAQSNKVIAVGIHRYQSSNPSGEGYDPFTYNTHGYPNAPASYPTGRLDRMRTWSVPQPSYLHQVLELTANQNNLGLAILDTSLSGNRLSFKVKVGIGEAKDPYNNNFKDYRKFGLVVYLLEDDLIYDQVNYTGYYGGGDVISNFEHDDVLRSSLTQMGGDDISVNYRGDGSVYTRSFDISIPTTIEDRSKLKIVAFVVGSMTGYANTVLNVQSAKVGEGQGFQVSN